jgi:hypothetical protein
MTAANLSWITDPVIPVFPVESVLSTAARGARADGLKYLAHFTVRGGFLELTAGVLGDDRSPERDCGLVVLEFGNLPDACEPIEDELRSVAADAQTSRLVHDVELGHTEVDLIALIARRSTHEREPDWLVVFEDDQRMGAVVGEPARHELGLTLAEFTDGREHPGIHAQPREIFQIVRVLRLDPGPVLRGVLCVANADWHDASALPLPPPMETVCRPGKLMCCPTALSLRGISLLKDELDGAVTFAHCAAKISGVGIDGRRKRRPTIACARLLSRGRRVLGGFASLCGGVAGSIGGVGRRVGGSFASCSSSIARSGGGVGRGVRGVARSFTSSGGGVLSSLGRGLFLLCTGGQRQRQRKGSKKHLCIHVIYHPDVVVN